MPSEAEVAWLAGVVEGEGSFFADRREGQRTSLALAVEMTDEDIIRRVKEVAGGGGNVCGPYLRPSRYGRPHSETFKWRVNITKDTLLIAKALYPHLGQRRRAKIDSLRKEALTLP